MSKELKENIDASEGLEVSELDVRAMADDLNELTELTEDEEYDEEEHIRSRILKLGPPPASWDEQQLQFFRETYRFESEIKRLSAGLDREEVLNYYGLTDGILPEYDQYFFDICFIRGRMDAKHKAVQRLFDQMGEGRNGTHAALAYLNRFANSFKGEAGKNEIPKAIKIEVVS